MKVGMMRNLGVLLLVAALILGLGGAALAATQVWYLNDTVTTPGREMDRGTTDAERHGARFRIGKNCPICG